MSFTTQGGDAASGTDLVERYVREVGRHLPRARRADVIAELRGLLGDQIDDRLEHDPGASLDAVTTDVLRELGPPADVARRYAPAGDVWIGPELYPAFRTTAVIVLVVYCLLTALWVTGSSFDVAVIPFHLEFDASRHWSDILLGGIANVGVVSLLFGAFERLARLKRPAAEAWEPRDLPRIQDPDRISVTGEVVGLAFTALFAFIFNFAPGWLGLFVIPGDQWGPFPVLRPEYRVHLPWLNAWWAGAFALHLAILRQGCWRTWSRAAELALGLFGAGVLYRVVTGGRFTILDALVKPVLAIAIAVTLIVSIVRAVRWIRRIVGGAPEPAPEV